MLQIQEGILQPIVDHSLCVISLCVEFSTFQKVEKVQCSGRGDGVGVRMSCREK